MNITTNPGNGGPWEWRTLRVAALGDGWPSRIRHRRNEVVRRIFQQTYNFGDKFY